jgi:hypothetical protein
MRFFNTAGPVNCDKHYCLPPLQRFNLPQIMELIAQEKYFVLHAPRQTGKTSCLLALMDHLNREGRYRALYANLEAAQGARENVGEAIGGILGEISERARVHLKDESLRGLAVDSLKDLGAHNSLNYVLSRWAEASNKPLVLLIDEIDSLVGDTLISVLRQIRSGYDKRPQGFPSTVLLCGVRDVRDYRIHSDKDKVVITGGSAFNIKAESLRLGNFSRQEVEALFRQHTKETGQIFEAEALDKAWDLTGGQPWLVNALAYEACFKMPEGLDRSRPVTCEMIAQAKENLIERRETHLDQLADKLKEERVRRVVEPILMSESFERQFRSEDVEYVTDLGLISQDRTGALDIANRIYHEIIPRQLTWNAQMGMALQPAWYIQPDGCLDLSKLLEAFQQFFREHSESWLEMFDYREAGPQLLMQAFLQRIVNGGGHVEREYGLGRGRTDLLVIWPFPGGVQRAVIELKVLHKSMALTVREGLAQVREYADRCGAAEAHLVVFDRTRGTPWSKKIFSKREIDRAEDGTEHTICIWGM